MKLFGLQFNKGRLCLKEINQRFSRHIKNVYSDKELFSEATVAKFAIVQIEGD